MERVDCNLQITALVECPNKECENVFDLFEMENLTDGGYLYKQLLLDGVFGKENLGEMVECPFCRHKFIIGDVTW